MRENEKYYRLLPHQINCLYNIVNEVSEDTVLNTTALEQKYNINLLSAYTVHVQAFVNERTKQQILNDSSYIADQYRRLTQQLSEYIAPAQDSSHDLERAERAELQAKLNRLLDEFKYNYFSDLLKHIEKVQPGLEQVKLKFESQYKEFITYNMVFINAALSYPLSNMNYDSLVRLSSRRRKKYLENFEMKQTRPEVQEFYNAIINCKNMMKRYGLHSDFIMSLMYNNTIVSEDKQASLQRLDTWMLIREYLRANDRI